MLKFQDLFVSRRGQYTSQFQYLLQVMVLETVWYWHKDRYIYQRIKIGSPEINPYIYYGQLIFNKRVETIKWGKNILQQVVLGQLDSHMQKNESSHTITKINSNSIKDLNVRVKLIQLL